MGFPNLGMHFMRERLAQFKSMYPESKMKIGVNIGKNKATSAHHAIDDYVACYECLAPLADYVAINISSPNTPGLRELATPAWLSTCLKALTDLRSKYRRPLFIKLSPDLQHLSEYDEFINVARTFHLDGLIATNTTAQHHYPMGGISGLSLRARSEEVRTYLLAKMQQHYPQGLVMGVGGIADAASAATFWQQGGLYVQLYTALIYQGPSIIAKILQSFSRNLSKNE
jgi:dihydroorotate dehydrogenase